MEELAQKINKEIKASVEFQEYLFWKDKVESDSYLSKIKEEMDELKKTICKSKNDGLLDKYYEKEKIYRNHPVVKQYLNSKETINGLLRHIVDILSLN